LCKSCRTCFMFYCMFYFTCDRSLIRRPTTTPPSHVPETPCDLTRCRGATDGRTAMRRGAVPGLFSMRPSAAGTTSPALLDGNVRLERSGRRAVGDPVVGRRIQSSRRQTAASVDEQGRAFDVVDIHYTTTSLAR